ncbi:hypothetical protein AGDE_14423 [Angomonas deanei]|uniref:Uncharacterized protein n=1 Tax=Angomonas deanei TaxID=59799 RepID=A0A7G2CUP9_9TRYP|nr:hypothetical protein AGDE_14423 [Angomonas deanei]CAD2222133.1 hypothetical protein, conserved [Angomonas deanei]|eukprot:EPY20895.1 hypothetical protein AGDE_14423 [Angomonas deanei]
MMRHPPISCARSVGQLMAYAAVKAGDPKVFMLMLKTMKKPVDNYLLGAYMFLTQGNPPTPNQATTTTKGKKDKTAKKEDVVEELKNDLVDIMNAALSHGGHLVDREDQHTLQATLIQALRSYPKSNKKRADMLEAALALFGDRQMPKNPPPMAKDSGMSTPSHTSTTPSAVKAAAKPVEPTAAAAAVEEVPRASPTQGGRAGH